MELIFLGTTAAVPSSERGHSSIALKYRDEVLLWDCGEGTQRQLIRSRTSYMRVKKIFITHYHGDHFLGLPGLFQTMSFAGRQEELTVYGPKGINDLVGNILDLGEYELSFNLTTKRITSNFSLKDERYTIRGIKVKHSLPTYGLLFEEVKGREFLIDKAKDLGIKPGPAYSRLQRGERVKVGGRWVEPEEVLGERKKGYKVLYSSDTRPIDEILDNCEGSTLIHDATFDDSLAKNARETYHSTCVDAAEIANKGRAKELFLTHISPRYKKDEVLLNQARSIFPRTTVARDLMRIKPRL
jgi:ribonuclease Z